MSTAAFTIVTLQNPGDGHLVPRWTGGDTIRSERGDGVRDELPSRRVVFGRLGRGVTTELELDDVSARVLITDCRTVVVCRRFLSKDGGWIGMGWGAAFALVANLVHKARAAAEGSGKAAVGHVRHEWVRFVGWKDKASGGSADEVRLGFRLPGHETTQLGSSSSGELMWHNEDAYHPLRPDWICLLCLRNPDQTATSFVPISDVPIEEPTRSLLFQRRFRIEPDSSNVSSGAAKR